MTDTERTEALPSCPNCGAAWGRSELVGGARHGGGYLTRCHECGHEWGNPHASHGARAEARGSNSDMIAAAVEAHGAAHRAATAPEIPDRVDLIVTHGGCHDGFTAEWLLHMRWPDAAVHPGAYNENIDRLVEMGETLRISAGQTIRPGDERPSVLVMADFSYKPEPMLRLALAWDRIILLDHHASAIDALDGRLPGNVECVFDVDRSGAGITADWLGVRGMYKGVVDYVEDRDLWRFALPESREAIQYLIAATPHTYEAWTELDIALSGPPAFSGAPNTRFRRCVEDGKLIGRYHDLIVDELVGKARPAIIDGHDVLVTCSPYLCGSDVAGRLAERSPSGIGAYYQDLPDRREYGLRSGDNGPNVAEVAERLGGGGHPHASGFRTDPVDIVIE